MAVFPNSVSLKYVGTFFGYGPPYYQSVLCKASGINMWSKYKPVRFAFSNPKPANWWKANDNNCGIVVSGGSFDFDLAAFNGVYEYEKPRGGQSEPYRKSDFQGYNHDATFQYYADFPGVLYDYNMNSIRMRERNDLLSLTMADILDQFYPSKVYVICQIKPVNGNGGGQKIYMTTQEPLTATSGDQTIYLDFKGSFGNWFRSGTRHQVTVALCNFKLDKPTLQTSSAFPPDHYFWGLPYTVKSQISEYIDGSSATPGPKYTINVDEKGIRLTSITYTQVRGSFTLVNNGSDSRPFNTGSDYARFNMTITFLDNGETVRFSEQLFRDLSPSGNWSLAKGEKKDFTFWIDTGLTAIMRPYEFGLTILQSYNGSYQGVGSVRGSFQD